jgi:hypothetical protein
VDVVALASVISSATVGLAGAGVALYSARRTAQTVEKGRVEQRASDGYLKVLSLAEQEAQWLDSRVYNFGLDRKELEYDVVTRIVLPKPELTDRATASALIAAFASNEARAAYVTWRQAADDLARGIEDVVFNMTEDGDPYANVPEEWMKPLTEDLQPKEDAARRVLAEAVAHELGHRRVPTKRLRLGRR